MEPPRLLPLFQQRARATLQAEGRCTSAAGDALSSTNRAAPALVIVYNWLMATAGHL